MVGVESHLSCRITSIMQSAGRLTEKAFGWHFSYPGNSHGLNVKWRKKMFSPTSEIACDSSTKQ